MTTLFIFIGAQMVSGHVVVIEETPTPNSTLEIPPSEVKIRFNSKVEKNFTIKLMNENQREIKPTSSEITLDQREIKIKLPGESSHLTKTPTPGYARNNLEELYNITCIDRNKV